MTIPPKNDLPKTLKDIVSTFTEEMLRAAVKRARDLGFNLSPGQLTIDETLINLRHNRDLLADAINKQQLQQLPLKLQYDLLQKAQRIAEALNGLVNGTDTVSTIEDSVEDLTAITWQYHLQHRSDTVLGYEQKMNQLKAQEVLLNQATAEARTFLDASTETQRRLQTLDSLKVTAEEHLTGITGVHSNATTIAGEITGLEQRASAVLATLERYDTAAAQHAADANVASASAASIADYFKTVQPELDSARATLDELITETTTLVAATTARTTEAINDLDVKGNSAQQRVNDTITEMRTSIDQHRSSAGDTIVAFIDDARNEFERASKTHEASIDAQLATLLQRGDTTIAQVTERADTVIANNNSELQRLTADLGALEEGIRKAIERATGYTLFHAFQRRQEDLVKSKKFWAYALATAVAFSLAASGAFIWGLQYVTQYNAAFFLKLSISLPLIYAIAFCSIQYARERRLEEEYAFKSAISISLDPYQRLVAELVNGKDEERAKYTAFVIESITRVFTSPTERVFDDQPTDKNAAEKTIKAAGDLIEPILRAFKK